jgi:hypothetical protein
MTGQSSRREVFANPFFAVLLLTSTLFVFTVLAYLVSPYVLAPKPGQRPQGASSMALAAWLDRNAPQALGLEFIAMLLMAVLAVATDRWFSKRSRPSKCREPG